MRRTTTLVMPLLVICSILFGAVPGTASAVEGETPEEEPVSESAPTLAVTNLNPEVFTGKEDVRIDLEISGLTESELSTGDSWVIETFLQPTPFTSVLELENYLEGDGFPGWRVSVDTLSSLSVQRDSTNSTTSFAVTVPLEQMPAMDPHTTGARGLNVRISSNGIVLEARSILFSQPYEGAPKTNIHLVAVTPVTPNNFADASANNQNGDPLDGALLETVQEVSQISGVSLAVEPSFFEGLLAGEIQTSTPDEESPEPSGENDGTPPAFLSFQREILSKEIEIISLPTENADISHLAAASLDSLSKTAGETRVSTEDLRPEIREAAAATLIDNTIFATPEGFTRHSLRSLGDNTIVSPSGWAPVATEDPDITPTTRLEIDTANGEVVGIPFFGMDDNFASEPGTRLPPGNPNESELTTVTVLDQWDEVHQLLNHPKTTPQQELLIRQTLRAASLLVGLEDPNDQRTLSAVMMVDPQTGSKETVGRVDALLNNSWVTPVSFRAVLESPLSSVARETVSDATTDNDYALQEYHQLLAPLADELAVATSIVGSTSLNVWLLHPYLNDVFAATQPGLDPAERSSLIQKAQEHLSEFTNIIQVVSIGTVNIVTRSTQFPVSVHNSGPVEVAVQIYLVPSDPRLQSSKKVDATVPANGQIDVTIPVTAVGSGDVSAKIIVAAQDGTILDDSQEIKVRVRANWEDTVTLGVGVTLIVLFLFGIIRTVRKGQRRSQPTVKEWDFEYSGLPDEKSQETTDDSLD